MINLEIPHTGRKLDQIMENKVTDVIIIGAGHNGLVAAIFLARQGLKVTVLEEKSTVGGAARTEYPFAKAPLWALHRCLSAGYYVSRTNPQTGANSN